MFSRFPMTRRFIVFLFSFCFIAVMNAASRVASDEAQDAYQRKDYVAAAVAYEKLEKAEPGTYNYNLGNCYYRLGDYARAMLYYRRAVRLNPADEDAAFNFELTQTKLTDRFDAPSEMFFVTWMRSFIDTNSASAWGHFALVFLVAAFALLTFYFLGKKMWVRKAGFFLSLTFFVFTFASWLFAYLENNRFDGVEEWVVANEVQTYTSPSFSSKKGIQLHEGTLLRLTDETNGNWQEVVLPDGTSVWVVKSDDFLKV